MELSTLGSDTERAPLIASTAIPRSPPPHWPEPARAACLLSPVTSDSSPAPLSEQSRPLYLASARAKCAREMLALSSLLKSQCAPSECGHFARPISQQLVNSGPRRRAQTFLVASHPAREKLPVGWCDARKRKLILYRKAVDTGTRSNWPLACGSATRFAP